MIRRAGYEKGVANKQHLFRYVKLYIMPDQ